MNRRRSLSLLAASPWTGGVRPWTRPGGGMDFASRSPILLWLDGLDQPLELHSSRNGSTARTRALSAAQRGNPDP